MLFFPCSSFGMMLNVRFDALQPLEIRLEAVQENAVQAMAGDLGERRVRFGLDALRLLELAPYSDHEQAVGAQMQARTEREQSAASSHRRNTRG
jgi:hypothetical protein